MWPIHLGALLRPFRKTCRLIQQMAGTGAPPLTSKVNPTTGKLEWVVEDENYDYVQEIARSAYTDMLHDDERNKKYLIGIKKAIAAMHSRGQQADVLDIGTGTGLLAMMAAQNGADTVHACEAFEPIGKAAQKIVTKNGFDEKIKVIMKRSTEVTVGPDGDLPKRANILPAEVFDTELIGEGAIPTYLHAHKYLLTDDCICVPHSATVYAQLVQSEHLHNCHKLQPIRVTETDRIIPHEKMSRCAGAASVYDLQLSQVSPDLFEPITEPLKMLNFNFSRGDFRESGTNTVRVSPLVSGQCHCVFMWWELQMDTEGEVLLSTAPTWAHPEGSRAPWRDHWMQAIYYLPEPVNIQAGQPFDITISHDDYSLWFAVNSQGPVERPICQCGSHAVWGRPRFAMLNDSGRNEKFISALKKVVTPESTCLSVSDGSLLPLIAAKLGARQVYSIESNSLSRRVMGDIVSANHLENGITLIQESAQDLKPGSIKSKIDILMAEPYYTSSLLPWHSLYFWYCRTSLAGHLSADAVILPRGATLKAVAMEFDHLWKFYAPVGDLEGFDVRIFDDLTQNATRNTDATEEPHHLWEYPGRPLTSDFEVMTFDFTKCVPDTAIDVRGDVPFIRDGMGIAPWTDFIVNDETTVTTGLQKQLIQSKLDRSGTCHGIALWMDFIIDDETTVTTGLQSPVGAGADSLSWCRSWKQGVHFMKLNPKVDDRDGWKLVYEATFKPTSGSIFFNFRVADR